MTMVVMIALQNQFVPRHLVPTRVVPTQVSHEEVTDVMNHEVGEVASQDVMRHHGMKSGVSQLRLVTVNGVNPLEMRCDAMFQLVKPHDVRTGLKMPRLLTAAEPDDVDSVNKWARLGLSALVSIEKRLDCRKSNWIMTI